MTTSERDLTEWLTLLISLEAMREYLERHGWSKEDNDTMAADRYTKPGLTFDDGEPVEIPLPLTQNWEWSSYYRAVDVETLAIVEYRDALAVVKEMVGDVDHMIAHFARANDIEEVTAEPPCTEEPSWVDEQEEGWYAL